MDLNEELRKRHGITKLSSLRHAELTPSMLPAGISHYRGWIYDKNSFTLDQVRAFIYNACLSCVSAAKFYDLPVATGELPQRTHLSVRHSRGMHFSKLRRFDDVCVHWEPVLSEEEERTHVASIGTVLERVLVCMPLKVSLPMLDAARNRGLYDVSTLAIPPTGSRLPHLREALSLSSERARSILETVARLQLIDMGLTPQVGVWIEGVGEVDMIILGFIVIEVDGWAFHSSKEQREKDLKRDRELLRRGYVVLRFTYDDVMNGDFAREVPVSVEALRRLVPDTGTEDAQAAVKNAGFLDILRGYLPSYHPQH